MMNNKMKKTVLAIFVSTMSIATAQASTTVFRADQANHFNSQLNATGNVEAPTDYHLTIQGDDSQTYDLQAMQTGITDNTGKIDTNAAAIKSNTDLINDNKTHTDAWIVSVAADAATNVDLQKEVTRATDVEAQHTTELASHDNELGDHENRLVDMKQNVDGNTQDIVNNKAKIAANTSNIQSAVDASAYAMNSINTVKQDQVKTDQRVASHDVELANHEQRIQDLEAKDTVNFGKLQNEVNANRQRASAAISGVAAMANIPQVIQGQTLSVGAGVGTTDGERALAVGFSARASEHTIVKASVSDDSQQNFVVGGGVSYGW